MILSPFSQVHLPSTCQSVSAQPLSESILWERRVFLGLWAHYIQVRESQTFIIALGPVKATQLCAPLTYAKTLGPLNGLPAGLFMVMGFSHTDGEEKEDPVLWQIVWVMVELFNLCCIPLFYFKYHCLCSSNVKRIWRVRFTSYWKRRFMCWG